MESFYVAVGIVLVIGSVGWMASSRARHRMKRFAFGAAVVALILAVLYSYSKKADVASISSIMDVLG